MSRHLPSGLPPEEISKAIDRVARTLDRHSGSQASGEIRSITPLTLTVPAFLAPRPDDEAVSRLELNLRGASSEFKRLNVLLAEVCQHRLSSQVAAAVADGPRLAGKALDDRLDGFLGELNVPLGQTNDPPHYIHTTRGLHDKTWGSLNPRGRRALRDLSSNQSRPRRVPCPDPDVPSSPTAKGGDR